MFLYLLLDPAALGDVDPDRKDLFEGAVGVEDRLVSPSRPENFAVGAAVLALVGLVPQRVIGDLVDHLLDGRSSLVGVFDDGAKHVLTDKLGRRETEMGTAEVVDESNHPVRPPTQDHTLDPLELLVVPGQLGGLTADRRDHAVERACQTAELVFTSDLETDRLISSGKPTRCLLELEDRSDESPGCHPGQDQNHKRQDGAGEDCVAGKLPDGGERLAGISFSQYHPIEVLEIEGLEGRQHLFAAVVGGDGGRGEAIESLANCSRVDLLEQDRSVKRPDPAQVDLRYSRLLELGEIGLRVLEEESRVRPQPAVRADEIGLTGGTQSLAEPLLVVGHHSIDFANRHLEDESSK